MEGLTIEFLQSLKYGWSAEVILTNNQPTGIWYTALPTAKDRIKEIVSVSSDYPRHEVNKEFIIN